jgi:hypothetical protein
MNLFLDSYFFLSSLRFSLYTFYILLLWQTLSYSSNGFSSFRPLMLLHKFINFISVLADSLQVLHYLFAIQFKSIDVGIGEKLFK